MPTTHDGVERKFVPGQIDDDMVLFPACSERLIDPPVQQLEEKLPTACWGKTGFDQESMLYNFAYNKPQTR